jgi:enterochelin esterase-like enzyme
MSRFLVVAICCFSIGAIAQTPGAVPAAPLASRQVNSDHTITFRYAAPSATKVMVGIDAYPKPLAMTKDANGVWSVTTEVLPPEYYIYEFIEDGVHKLDPLNPNTIQNYDSLADVVLIPSQPAAAWELTDIPHGRVDHHLYATQVAKDLPENQESYVVYTPPGYDAKRKGGYPVLYLLHGWSDTADGWTANGHADLILDTLLAEKKAVPMIVVMPLGYGDLDFATQGFSVWQDPAKVLSNVDLFSKMLLSEIIPAVEREYNVARGRDNRAIAGLSMGGLESLTIGLNHPDQFAYVAGMSSAVFGGKFGTFEAEIPTLDAKKASLRLLWVGCGRADGLFASNQKFIAWTKTKGLAPMAVETTGAHTWLTWRENLLQLAPLLFVSK